MATKPPFPAGKVQELQDAWNARNSLPKGIDQGKYQQAIKDLMAGYSPPEDPREHGPYKELEQVLGAIDYAPGIVRTAAIAPAEYGAGMISGRQDLKDQALQDVKNAVIPFSGKLAPSFGEAAQRLGIPEGPSVDTPAGPISARGAGGFALDMLSSPGLLQGAIQNLMEKAAPMTAKALGQQLAEKGSTSVLQKLAGVAGAAADPAMAIPRKAGEALYDSAFKNADEAAYRAGKDPISDIALRRNVVGTSGGVRNQLMDVVDKNSTAVQDMVDKAAGQLPSQNVMTKSDFLNRARFNLKQDLNTTGTRDAAQQALEYLEGKFAHLRPDDTLNISQLNAEKKAFQSLARDSGAYASQPETAAQKPTFVGENKMAARLTGQAQADVAHTARRGVEDMLDRIQPGQGGEAFLKNNDTSSILSAEKALNNQAGKSAMSAIRDALPLGAIMGGSAGMVAHQAGYHNPGIALAALAAAMASSTPGRTGLGLFLNKGGTLLGPAARALTIEDLAPFYNKPSPWSLLNQEINK